MPGVSYLEKVNSELLTYHNNPVFSYEEFGFIDGAGDGANASIIDCTCLGASGGASKQLRLQAFDNDSNSVVFQLWFGDTREAVEAAIADQDPAEIIMMSGSSTDFTMPISAKWIAIDYNASLSTVDKTVLYLSLYIN
jgi:hypothetical protein